MGVVPQRTASTEKVRDIAVPCADQPGSTGRSRAEQESEGGLSRVPPQEENPAKESLRAVPSFQVAMRATEVPSMSLMCGAVEPMWNVPPAGLMVITVPVTSPFRCG